MTHNAIKPVISAEEWRDPRIRLSLDYGTSSEILKRRDFESNTEQLPALIAVANDALPDVDPRKITREMVDDLIRAGDATEGAIEDSETVPRDEETKAFLARLRRHIDALESYLPPEGA